MLNSAEQSQKSKPPAIHDWDAIRKDFPALAAKIYGKPLVYLDNAATAHKPQAVLDSIAHHYTESNANIHRGVHFLSQNATDAYENARKIVAQFVGANANEIIFTRGTTESINLAASTFGRNILREGDEIVITQMEHHSNLVPWQLLCKEKGARLRVMPVSDNGELITDDLDTFLGSRTKLIALAHVSNSLGTINPAREIIAAARERGIPTLLDGAQAIPHLKIDVRELDCDFYAFSGHKLFGPSGIGALYVRREILQKMPPYQSGGGMIRLVTFERTTFADAPEKFEAGTPNIEGAIGLASAIKYIQSLGMSDIELREHELLRYANERLSEIYGIKIYGKSPQKVSVISFTLGDIHPHDIGSFLDREGIAVRTGHHCNQPLWQHFGVSATTRASLAFYNTEAEIDILTEALHSVVKFFA